MGGSPWTKLKENNKLQQNDFNDRTRSFQWSGLAPEQEVVNPFTVKVPQGTGQSFRAHDSGTNRSPLPDTGQLSFTEKITQSVTVQSTDEFATGLTITTTFTTNELVVEASVSIQLSFTYTHSQTNIVQATDENDYTYTETYQQPPNCSWVADLSVNIVKMPPTLYVTTAERWYAQPLQGATLDPTNGWYKRTEPVSVLVSGGLVGTKKFDFKSTPLPST